MTHALARLVVSWVVLVCSLAAQAPPAAQAAGTARIRGRVVAADTGAPLRRATVQMRGPIADGGTGAVRSTMTDADGRYEFTNVAAGRYSLSASRTGYVDTQLGRRRAFAGSGAAVPVSAGQTINGLDIGLRRAGVIAGRVVDAGNGEPLPQLKLQALRYEFTPDGRRRLSEAGVAAMTDDLGQFRLYGLSPGEYAVTASYEGLMSVGSTSNVDIAKFRGVPSYYPGVAIAADAEPVVVGFAQEVTVQFPFVVMPRTEITGIVADARGMRVDSARLTLIPRVAARAANPTTRSYFDGGFVFSNVAAGEYLLEARLPGDADRPGQIGWTPVHAAGGSLKDVTVSMSPATTIRGRVEFDGAGPRPASVRVHPQSMDTGGVALLDESASNGVADADGRFQITGAYGRVLLAATAGAWAPKAMFVDGRDVTHTPIDLTGRGLVDDVRIVMTDRATWLRGGARDRDGRPVSDYVAVLVRTDLLADVTPWRGVRLEPPQADGRFAVRVLPGTYAVVSVDDVEPGDAASPRFLAWVRENGRSYTVAEGEAVMMELPLLQVP